AFVLSAMKSVDSLKGKLKTARENSWLRKSLVAFQFGTAAIVFIGAIVISQQVAYFFSNNLGYDKEYILYAQLPRNWSPQGVAHMETVRRELASLPQVSNASLSFEIPNGMNSGSLQIYKPGSDSTQAITAQEITTDNHYAATYSIPMKAGVFFSPDYTADSTKVVINETQCKALGWQDPQQAIGQQLRLNGFNDLITVSGVTADFHFDSMQARIQPITFLNVRFNTIYRYFSIKLKPGNVDKSIAAVQKSWAALMPGAPFEYNFIDDALSQLYNTELRLKKAAYTATGLAIIIVLLGVVGLISLSIQKKTKEIGIRKVIGASVGSIIGLFLREYLPLIVAAGLLSCLPAWLLMRHWLNGYAYRTSLTALPFLTAIAVLGLITTLLILLQTTKAANANPVKSLRTE
ncbi:MAG: ABC transporter permease, partial [Bacteroidetes bacterium]|nr:ABC transporter permease [Bacteroidota bacterium]